VKKRKRRKVIRKRKVLHPNQIGPQDPDLGQRNQKNRINLSRTPLSINLLFFYQWLSGANDKGDKKGSNNDKDLHVS